MNSKKMLLVSKFIVVFALISFVLPSCSKDDDPSTPAYVGTWQEETSESAAPAINVAPLYVYRTVLVLEEASYNRLEEYKILDAKDWITENGEKGSVSVVKNVFTITSLQETVPVYNANQEQTGLKYVDITVDMRETFKAQWSVANNKLTLIIDLNDDEKFDVLNDYQRIFTKL